MWYIKCQHSFFFFKGQYSLYKGAPYLDFSPPLKSIRLKSDKKKFQKKEKLK